MAELMSAPSADGLRTLNPFPLSRPINYPWFRALRVRKSAILMALKSIVDINVPFNGDYYDEIITITRDRPCPSWFPFHSMSYLPSNES